MYFKSRTDVDGLDANAPVPAMGPAGTIVTDDEFATEIVRVADEHTIVVDGQGKATNAGLGGSADVNTWNTDSTLMHIQDSGGGGAILSFDPKTLAAKRVFPKWRTGSVVFSRLDPHIAFVFKGLKYERYDLRELDRDTPPTPEVVCDFSGLLGTTSAKWQTIGGVEGSDTLFSAGFSVTGAQGTGVHCCVYVAGKGYRLFNTETGEISGDFGPTGPISIEDRFTIHNVKTGKGGKVVTIGVTEQSGDGRSPFFWEVESRDVYPMARVAAGGHWSTAYGKFYNHSSIHTDEIDIDNWAHAQRWLNEMDTPSQVAMLYPNPDDMYGLDDHISFNGPPNSMFVSISTSAPSPGKHPPYPAWWDEVLGFDLDGSGKVYRFCRHFSDTHHGNFAATNAIGVVDQLNRFVAFTSNWKNTLLNQRNDVFVAKLH